MRLPFLSTILICASVIGAQILQASDTSIAHNESDSAGVVWATEITAGSPSSVDVMTALMTDADGNTYVTGRSDDPDGLVDYLTIKYSPLGLKLWSARFDGSSGGTDIPTALAVSGDGSVYVSGRNGHRDSISNKMVTVKYNRNGRQEWVATYATGGEYTSDSPQQIIVDREGNTVVLGAQHSINQSNPIRVLVKYDGSGNLAWVLRDTLMMWYAEMDIALDEAGNVYVSRTKGDTTSTDTLMQVYLTKINGAGDIIWERYLVGSGASHSQYRTMTLDRSGSVIVVAFTADHRLSVFKVNSHGELLWESSRDSYLLPALVQTDRHSNIFIVSSSDQGATYTLLKLNAQGEFEWDYSLAHGTLALNPSAAIIVSQDGNILFVSARWDYFGGNNDSIIVTALNQEGGLRWRQGLPMAAGFYGAQCFVGADLSGNAIVGYTAGGPHSMDLMLKKYSDSGLLQWERREGGRGAPSDGTIYAMRLDGAGNAYVAGVTRNANSGFDFLVAKVSPQGVVEWTATYDGPAHKHDVCHYLELDNQGNVYVAGSSRGPLLDNWMNYALIKYNADGVQQWVRRVEDDGNNIVHDLFIDNNGNVYVAGSAGIRVYAPDGTDIWSTTHPTRAVTVDDDGVIFAAQDNGVVRYDSIGATTLIPSSFGALTGITLDDSGNVYPIWASPWYPPRFDVSKYSPEGVQQWGNAGQPNVRLLSSGEVYSYGLYLHKHDRETGTIQWTVPAVWEGETVFTVDDFGNGYAAGNKLDLSQPPLHVSKHDPAGNLLWRIDSGVDGWFSMKPYVLAASPAGDLYIAGDVERRDLSRAMAIVKIGSFGVDVAENHDAIPEVFSLFQNYPNPFNPSTTIRFMVPRQDYVSVKIYDVLGRDVATLVNNVQSPGVHTVRWDAAGASSGMYFCRLKSGDFEQTTKLLLLR